VYLDQQAAHAITEGLHNLKGYAKTSVVLKHQGKSQSHPGSQGKLLRSGSGRSSAVIQLDFVLCYAFNAGLASINVNFKR